MADDDFESELAASPLAVPDDVVRRLESEEPLRDYLVGKNDKGVRL
jgi:hypothetical protein